MIGGMSRAFYLTIAYLAVGLGLVGVFLPLLPTTPLMLVALWAATRSSERLRAWLLNHRLFGPPLQAWDRERAVPRRAKWLAVTALLSSWILLYWLFHGSFVPWTAGVPMLLAGVYVVTRPLPRSEIDAAPNSLKRP